LGRLSGFLELFKKLERHSDGEGKNETSTALKLGSLGGCVGASQDSANFEHTIASNVQYRFLCLQLAWFRTSEEPAGTKKEVQNEMLSTMASCHDRLYEVYLRGSVVADAYGSTAHRLTA
jgi:hypothetical protein